MEHIVTSSCPCEASEPTGELHVKNVTEFLTKVSKPVNKTEVASLIGDIGVKNVTSNCLPEASEPARYINFINGAEIPPEVPEPVNKTKTRTLECPTDVFEPAALSVPASDLVQPNFNMECHLTVQECDTLPSHVGRLSSGQFLDNQNLFRVLFEASDEMILADIPAGPKNNVFFVVDNTSNVNQRSQSKQCKFPDDCGVWISGAGAASPRTTYLVEGCSYRKLFVKKIDGERMYCCERRSNGKRVYDPLIPQPPPESLIEIQRMYRSLKRHPSYKKTYYYYFEWTCF